MSILARLFPSRPDPREQLRPLWHRVVEIARERAWYATHGVADTVAGRFDMITAVLATVLVRMEQEPELVEPSVLLTEIFVEDMDGQLREAGIGDMVVGKHIGRLMATLGGRLGAYRDGLRADGNGPLEDAVARNVSLNEGAKPEAVAAALRQLAGQLADMGGDAILSGEIGR